MKTPLRHGSLVPTLAASLLALAVGCGPSVGGDDDGVNPDGPDAAVDAPTCTRFAEVCDDGLDNDCDNIVDCDDADCEGNPICPAATCGTLETPQGMLALPDGACPEDETQPCAGYENVLNFTGFSQGQTLTDINKLLGICVNMEHSWMRDIVVYGECPNGTRVMLSDFAGHMGGEVFLGVPNGSDGGPPGTGWDYCWTPTATDLPWIPYANAHPAEHTLHSGDYQASQPLNAFVGCPLNGGWKIRVEDRWGIDDGYIFSWSVRFDPSIVEDCENWPD
jgi:hypothetical protein